MAPIRVDLGIGLEAECDTTGDVWVDNFSMDINTVNRITPLHMEALVVSWLSNMKTGKRKLHKIVKRVEKELGV